MEQLGEPSLAAMQAGWILLREYINERSTLADEQREIRDVCAGILHAQLTGVTPKTSSET